MIRYEIGLKILVAVLLYYVLKYTWPQVGQIVLFPITRLVTILHEMGHALAAVLTGGQVEAVQINMDGSGYTKTRGGWRTIILMGGYVGSAVFGNLMLYASIKSRTWQRIVLYTLAILMLLTGIIWFNSLFSTIVLLLFAAGFFWLANKGKYLKEILIFLGMVTTLYIIEDFGVGPRSDLQQYAEVFGIGSYQFWMYVWLIIVGIITLWNLTRILWVGKRKT